MQRQFLKKDLFKYDEKVFEGRNQFRQLAKIYSHNIADGDENNTFLRGLFDLIVYPIYSRSNSEIPPVLKAKGMCKPGFRKLFVDTDGAYYMCEKIGRRLELGTVKEGFDKKKSAKAYNRYSSIKNNLCDSCWASRLCDSCAASAKTIGDISETGQEKTCSAIKEKIIQGGT